MGLSMDRSSRKKINRDFPGGPVVKTLCFQCQGHGFDPWLGIPHAMQHGQKIKKINKATVLNDTTDQLGLIEKMS